MSKALFKPRDCRKFCRCAVLRLALYVWQEEFSLQGKVGAKTLEWFVYIGFVNRRGVKGLVYV